MWPGVGMYRCNDIDVNHFLLLRLDGFVWNPVRARKVKTKWEEGGTDDARQLTDGDPWIEDGQTNELWYCWSRSFCKTGKDKEKYLIWLNLD